MADKDKDKDKDKDRDRDRDKDKNKDKDDKEIEKESNLNEDEDEQDKDESKKVKGSFFNSKILRILLYTLLFFGFIFITTLISIFVVKYEKSSFDLNYNQTNLNRNISEPKDIYEIPEFKLALDKNADDVMTTIVQIKLFIAYRKGDQQVLNEIIKRKEQVKDRIQYIIASKTYNEISTAKSREDFLKEDLLYGLNSILNGEILDIYFDTFVISRIQSK